MIKSRLSNINQQYSYTNYSWRIKTNTLAIDTALGLKADTTILNNNIHTLNTAIGLKPYSATLPAILLH